MSEEKKARTVAEISQEYQGLCTRSGHLQYQINTMQKDLDLLNSTMRDLNFEAAAVQQKEAAAKAAAEQSAAAGTAASNGLLSKPKRSKAASQGAANAS